MIEASDLYMSKYHCIRLPNCDLIFYFVLQSVSGGKISGGF